MWVQKLISLFILCSSGPSGPSVYIYICNSARADALHYPHLCYMRIDALCAVQAASQTSTRSTYILDAPSVIHPVLASIAAASHLAVAPSRNIPTRTPARGAYWDV